jgi:hypothetical protein
MRKFQGYMVLEVLIAIVVIAMVLLSVVSMVRSSQLRTKKSDYDAEASALLQEGIEVAHDALVADWSGYPDGIYHPVFDAGNDSWVLVPGEETGLKTRFTRSIRLSAVCRDSSTGERKEIGEFGCVGDIDTISRYAESKITWFEEGTEMEEVATLLILNSVAE